MTALSLSTVSLLALAVASMASAFAQGGGDRSGAHYSSRSPVLARNGIAATSHPLASQVAVDVLKSGGTAVDAAIAANAAIGLMEPTGNGIGGDLFAIVWDPAARELVRLNASGRSPRGLDLEGMRELAGRGRVDPPPSDRCPSACPEP